MSRKEKLLKRLLSRPADFTYDEAKTLLNGFGYVEDNKGKTSGSRVSFFNEKTGRKFGLHKPHPKNTLNPYQIDDIIAELISARCIRP